MPQISLYVDEATLHKVQQAAKAEQVSVSSWVSNCIQEATAQTWPRHYFDLFGAVSKEMGFDPQQAPNFQDDVKRESLE